MQPKWTPVCMLLTLDVLHALAILDISLAYRPCDLFFDLHTELTNGNCSR